MAPKIIIENASYNHISHTLHPQRKERLPEPTGSFMYNGAQIFFDQHLLVGSNDDYYIKLRSNGNASLLPQLNVATMNVVQLDKTRFELVAVNSNSINFKCLWCDDLEADPETGCCTHDHAQCVYKMFTNDYREFLSDPTPQNRLNLAFKCMIKNVNKEACKKRKQRDDMDGRIREILAPIVTWATILESHGIVEHKSFEDLTNKSCTLDDLLAKAKCMRDYYNSECERQYQYFKSCAPFYEKYVRPDKNVVCKGLNMLVNEVSCVAAPNGSSEERAQTS